MRQKKCLLKPVSAPADFLSLLSGPHAHPKTIFGGGVWGVGLGFIPGLGRPIRSQPVTARQTQGSLKEGGGGSWVGSRVDPPPSHQCL